MCGIIGYVGKKAAAPILLEGLRRLEYRGYDSAGVAVLHGTDLLVRKKKGKIDDGLARLLAAEPAAGQARHRPHPLGHARPALRRKLPSAPRSIRQDRRRPQRRHRKLRPPQGQAAQSRAQVPVRDRHRSARASDRRVLRETSRQEIGDAQPADAGGLRRPARSHRHLRHRRHLHATIPTPSSARGAVRR